MPNTPMKMKLGMMKKMPKVKKKAKKKYAQVVLLKIKLNKMAIIEGYAWAENRSKLERAITEVRESGKELSVEAVKEVYIRMLGNVLEIKDGEVVKRVVKEAKKSK